MSTDIIQHTRATTNIIDQITERTTSGITRLRGLARHANDDENTRLTTKANGAHQALVDANLHDGSSLEMAYLHLHETTLNADPATAEGINLVRSYILDAIKENQPPKPMS